MAFLGKFKHPWWGWPLSALAAFLATLAPELIRGLCLVFAAIVAIATFHQTEFAGKRLSRTIPAALVAIILAVGLFFGARYFDIRFAHSEEAKNFPPIPSPIAPNVTVKSSPTPSQPSVQKSKKPQQGKSLPSRRTSPPPRGI
jgi:hypothetical protein